MLEGKFKEADRIKKVFSFVFKTGFYDLQVYNICKSEVVSSGSIFFDVKGSVDFFAEFAKFPANQTFYEEYLRNFFEFYEKDLSNFGDNEDALYHLDNFCFI